ncbi:TolC family protein, partial [Salinispira pacifica]
MRRLTAAVAILLCSAMSAVAEQSYSLDGLVRAALSGNPDIEQLVSTHAESEAALAGARSSLFPSLKFQNSYTYIANPPAYNITKGSLGSFTIPPAGPTVVIPQTDITVPQELDNWNINFGLQIEQPIFLWGKIRSNIALHRRIVQSDALQIEKKQAQIRTMVTVQYYSLFYLRQLRSTMAEQQSVAKEMLQIAQDSFKAGQINEADLTRKRMATREIDHAITGVDSQIETALRNLRSATGLTSLSVESIAFDAIDRQLDGADLAPATVLVDEALHGNRDVRLAAVGREIKREQIGVAKADTPLKPDLSLSANVTYGGPRLPFAASDWTDKDNFGGNISLVISAGIFDGGKSGAAVAQAEAQLDQAAFRAESAQREVRSYVEQIRYQLDVDRTNITYFESRVADNEKLVAYQKHLLDIGAG